MFFLYVLILFLFIVLLIASLVVAIYKYRFLYWRQKGIVCLEPSIPFGSANKITELSFAEQITDIYNEMRKRNRHCGGYYWFHKPMFMPIDLDLVKDILTKNFSHFTDRMVNFNDETVDPVSNQLATLRGAKWRQLRHKITPAFTSGKIKTMFQLMAKCSLNLEFVLDTQSLTGEPFDLYDVMSRNTIDNITTCAFGLDSSSLKHPDSEFWRYGKLAVEPCLRYLVADTLAVFCPRLLQLFRIRKTPHDIENFFTNILRRTIDYRQKNGVQRNDFLDLMMKTMNDPSPEKSITFMELVANSFVFFVAGFETSSSAMTYCLYELAGNQEVQDKTREEILSVLKNGELTYDTVNDMKYLGQVVDETLRMYPTVPVILRECTEDYVIPETNVTVGKGVGVLISILGIHRNPDFYPEPNKFDPNRFTAEEKSKRHSFAYIPFGEGPRNCIGFRFGLLQMKIGLAVLLRKYKFKLHPKTQLPLEFMKSGVLLTPANKIWMTCERI